MSYSEFPHTNYNDTDHHELILLYRRLVDSYEGTLQQITEVRNRLDAYQNSMTQHINEEVDARVKSSMQSFGSTIESDLNSIRTSIANLNNKADNYYETLNTLIERLREDVGSDVKELHQYDEQLLAQINSLNGTIVSNHNDLLRRIQSLDETLRTVIADTAANTLADATLYTVKQVTALDHKLSAQIEEIEKASGHKAIRWLWQYGCYHGGFNALQWYYLTPISAECWSHYSVTCVEWYVEAKDIFHRFDNRNRMFSPVSGRFVDVKVALMELAVTLNVNNMTAKEYDSLGLTADEYDRFFITAQEYDWAKKGEKLCTVDRHPT